MREDNFFDAIDGLGGVQPFQIFTNEFNDGELIEIDSLEALAVSEGTIVFRNPGGIRTLFDSNSVLRIFNTTVQDVFELKKHAITNRG